ncbi:MAG: hypothetical protein VR64_12595 [Desulfatitalea sp. BRH_c12]|nr:MAG: hypothetical protein VR64_12595 [Desulfatitalea sp. BRH_c12]
MKAVVFEAYGPADVLRIDDLQDPAPGPEDIVVRVRAAAVNPKDTFIRKGRFKDFTGDSFPQQTGFDFAGEVAAVNDRGTFQVGEPVIGMLDGWKGKTCAQFVAVKRHQLAAKPATLSWEQAAALPLVSLTALQALRDEGAIQPGWRVCINGASGGVGTMAVQIAKCLGASVTAVCGAESHARVKRLGADACIDYRQTDITRSGRLFDIFFDVFGNQPFAAVQPILTPTGTWISTVLKPEVFAAVEQTRTASGQKARLIVVRADADDLAHVARWAEDGRIEPIIHAVYPMDQIAAAHRQQETKHTHGKIVITIA